MMLADNKCCVFYRNNLSAQNDSQDAKRRCLTTVAAWLFNVFVLDSNNVPNSCALNETKQSSSYSLSSARGELVQPSSGLRKSAAANLAPSQRDPGD